MNFASDLKLVSWNEVRRDGDFVFMRRGTGETGWWHDHNDGTDYGGHPADYDRQSKKYKCRDCGVSLTPNAQAQPRSCPEEN